MPLFRHMEDSLEVAGHLWDDWLPAATRRQMSAGLPGGDADGRLLLRWLAGAHDIGKCTVAFACQVEPLANAMRDNGFAWRSPVTERATLPHALAGHHLTLSWLVAVHDWPEKAARNVASIVGSHHGVPPGRTDEVIPEGRPHLVGRGLWPEAQRELLEHITDVAGVRDRLPVWRDATIPQPALALLTAAVIFADWLASDANRFPYDGAEPSDLRASRAWAELSMTAPWTPATPRFEDAELLTARFQLPPGSEIRAVQRTVLEMARQVPEPCLLIVEAPMGVGKTEAALGAAEILAARFGHGGVFVALPTMATSNAMFTRVHRWVETLPSDGRRGQTMFLAHGKARLNEEFHGLAREWKPVGVSDCAASTAIAHSWLSGRKKGPMANFVVGSIDQVLFGALRSRHVMLRHLALANKVVVIDEVHAADEFMQVFLRRIVHWLAAYGVPTVLLSATLPSNLRRDLLTAYDTGRHGDGSAPAPDVYDSVNGDIGYPVVIASTGAVPLKRLAGDDGPGRRVRVEQLADDDETLVATLRRMLADGGCVAVVRNTVARAQATAELLSSEFDEDVVELLHSRFVDADRRSKEDELLTSLGPANVVEKAGRTRPQLRIVVGTQVIEQSLDVDFDLLVTDLAPVDLVLQRIGRLHRHDRAERPAPLREPVCLVTGVEDWGAEPPKAARGSQAVYGPHAMLRAASSLRPYWATGLELPRDIAALVQHSYGDRHQPPPGWEDIWRSTEAKALKRQAKRTDEARNYLLDEAKKSASLVGWLEGHLGEVDDNHRAQQRVRDGEDTVEVLLVVKGDDGIRVLPWVEPHGGRLIETDGATPPFDDIAQAAAACTLRLPAQLTRGAAGDELIHTLEKKHFFPAWQQSKWLAGYLVMALDKSLSYDVAGHRLNYDPRRGLLVAPLGGS